jgi:hypothetical protein
VLTVGIANPVLSVIEEILAISTLVVTILAPVLVLLVFAGVIFLILRRRRTRALA